MNWRLSALVLGAFLVVIFVLQLSGVLPQAAFSELIQGSLGKPRAISGTLKEATPLLIAGVAVFLALRAGLFNIGVEGQLLMGAMVATVVGLKLPGPMGILLGVLCAAIVGGLYALPAGLIKAYRGGHEVITTIMLNNIAILTTRAIVAGPLRDPNQESPTSQRLSDATLIGKLFTFDRLQVSLAILFAILLVIVLALWLARTVAGYELSAAGANPTAAKFAGIDVRRTTIKAMLWSGAIAGIAGAVQVMAYEGRFYAGFSPGYGFDALGVALLAGSSPFGLLPAAMLFGVLAQGGVSMALIGVPRGITGILLGLLIIVFAAFRYRRAANAG